MMNKYNFINIFESLLFSGFNKIKNLTKKDYKLLIKLVCKDLISEFYNRFENSYKNEYGNDDSKYLIKIQDFVFRIYTLVIINLKNKYKVTNYDELKGLIKRLLDDNIIDLYSSINYDETDILFINEQSEIINVTLSLMKHGL